MDFTHLIKDCYSEIQLKTTLPTIPCGVKGHQCDSVGWLKRYKLVCVTVNVYLKRNTFLISWFNISVCIFKGTKSYSVFKFVNLRLVCNIHYLNFRTFLTQVKTPKTVTAVTLQVWEWQTDQDCPQTQ